MEFKTYCVLLIGYLAKLCNGDELAKSGLFRVCQLL